MNKTTTALSQQQYSKIACSEVLCTTRCDSFIQTDTIMSTDLGLSCGNPLEFARLTSGETVLDLGCGAGRDLFLASKSVGATGKAIGIDINVAMLERASKIALVNNFHNVKLYLANIETLPIADNCIDLVICNCVIAHVADKQKVFNEIFRVLKPGGRFCIADIVIAGQIPPGLVFEDSIWRDCAAHTISEERYLAYVHNAGLRNLVINDRLIHHKQSEEFNFISITIGGEK